MIKIFLLCLCTRGSGKFTLNTLKNTLLSKQKLPIVSNQQKKRHPKSVFANYKTHRVIKNTARDVEISKRFKFLYFRFQHHIFEPRLEIISLKFNFFYNPVQEKIGNFTHIKRQFNAAVQDNFIISKQTVY